MNFADRVLEWMFDHVMPWVILGALVLLLGAGGVGLYQLWVAETIELDRQAWTCTATRDTTTNTAVISGNVIIPVPVTTTECMQWTRKTHENQNQ